jgi:hypothetical protein
MRPSFGYFDLVYVVKPYPAHTLLFAEFVQTLATLLTILGLMFFVQASFSGGREIEYRILLLFFVSTTVFYSLIVAFNSRYRGGLEFIIALAAAAAFARLFLRDDKSRARHFASKRPRNRNRVIASAARRARSRSAGQSRRSRSWC